MCLDFHCLLIGINMTSKHAVLNIETNTPEADVLQSALGSLHPACPASSIPFCPAEALLLEFQQMNLKDSQYIY